MVCRAGRIVYAVYEWDLGNDCRLSWMLEMPESSARNRPVPVNQVQRFTPEAKLEIGLSA